MTKHPALGFTGPLRTAAFPVGAVAVTAGVALHLPMYLGQADEGYMINGMGWDAWMIVGMALIVGGLAAALWSLFPKGATRRNERPAVEVEVPDDGHLSRPHIALLSTLVFAIAIDAVKPFTFAFILPGVAEEYTLSSPKSPMPGHLPVALYPLVGIAGTVIGSFALGYLADRIGRRSLILIAGTLFIGTSACGGMPGYGYNLIMCLVMGFAVGGLLPVAYSLLAETIPAKQRGAAIVLVAGVGTALGFVITSWLAHWLIPELNWRVLWFTGAPMGLALILLNRFIPESPRYLLANGREEEARAVMQRFGTTLAPRPESPDHALGGLHGTGGLGPISRGPLRGITFVLALYGLGWGIVNFGFLTWLPVNVSGSSVNNVTSILANAALFAFPSSVLVAVLYAKWSSKGTLVLSALLMAGSLIGFVIAGDDVARHEALFTALVTALLASLWGAISALSPYAAEIYPTEVRSTGSGLVAGATKFGGVLVLAMTAAAVAPPDVAGSALLGAVPAAAAALLLLRYGIETRRRSLEDIAVTTLGVADEPAA